MKKLNGGSIYHRKDGMWVGTMEMGRNANGKRVRRIVSSKDRSVVESKLRALNPDLRPVGFRPRAEFLADARTLGTHTEAEWGAKVRAHPKCRYCETDLNMFNLVKDHMTSLESGGSDSIDNVQPICWQCNVEKARTPHDQFAYRGEKPRPFSVMPVRRKMHARMMEARK